MIVQSNCPVSCETLKDLMDLVLYEMVGMESPEAPVKRISILSSDEGVETKVELRITTTPNVLTGDLCAKCFRSVAYCDENGCSHD